MTPFQWLGLVLAGAILVVLQLAAREYARRHWNNQRGVFWREAVGHGLVLVVVTAFCYVFGLSLLPVAVMWILSIVVLLMLLILDRADVLQFEPWPGLTERGNLRRPALEQNENTLSILGDTRVALVQQLEQVDLKLRQIIEETDRDLAMAQLQMMDQRYSRPLCTSGELRQRADEWVREARAKEKA